MGLALAGTLNAAWVPPSRAAEGPATSVSAEPVEASSARSPGDASRSERALVTGLSIAGGSLAAGSWLLAGTQDLRRIHGGLAVIGGGLTLAPLFAHGVTGEWARGAWFTLAPAIAGAGMVALLAAVPRAPVRGRAHTHTVVLFPAVLSLELLGGGIGIIDAVLVDERASSPVAVRGVGSPDFAGVELGGRW